MKRFLHSYIFWLAEQRISEEKAVGWSTCCAFGRPAPGYSRTRAAFFVFSILRYKEVGVEETFLRSSRRLQKMRLAQSKSDEVGGKQLRLSL